VTKANLPDTPPIAKDQIFDRLHSTVNYVLTLIPASRTVIGGILDSSFPYHTAPAKDFISHMKNLLSMTSYAPEQTSTVLRCIMEKALQIDVQVGIDIDPLDEEEQENLILIVQQGMQDICGGEIEPRAEENVDIDNANDDDDDDEDTAEMVLKRMKESMMKLDSAIDALFEYYETCCTDDTSGSSREFAQLIDMFKKSILTTHNARHIQYLLFRFAQINKSVYLTFITALLKAAFNKNLAMPTKCAAISYIASFAARGAQIDDQTVRLLFNKLSLELEKLRKRHESVSSTPDPDKFRFYYNMFQALMYMFCFRWRAFLIEPQEDESDDGYRWMPDIKENFNRHVMSPLNPLKVCAPVLVEMFAKVSNHLNFLYLYSKLETNKRVRLVRSVQFSTFARESSLSHNIRESALQLASQYTFEPYLLPTSKKWIEKLYLNFNNLAPPGMLDDDSSDEDGNASDDDNE
jgi:RNA polymerase I-specific transcription initiation factor RRN3